MSAKISVFDICVEVIIYLLLCNLHDVTCKFFYHCLLRAVRFMLIFVSNRIGCFLLETPNKLLEGTKRTTIFKLLDCQRFPTWQLTGITVAMGKN